MTPFSIALTIVIVLVVFTFLSRVIGRSKPKDPKQQTPLSIFRKGFVWTEQSLKQFLQWQPKPYLPKGCSFWSYDKDGNILSAVSHNGDTPLDAYPIYNNGSEVGKVMALNRKNAKRKIKTLLASR